MPKRKTEPKRERRADRAPDPAQEIDRPLGAEATAHKILKVLQRSNGGLTLDPLVMQVGEHSQRVRRYVDHLLRAKVIARMQRGKRVLYYPIGTAEDLNNTSVRASGGAPVIAPSARKMASMVQREKDRERIAADVDAYLARGGKVTQLAAAGRGF